MELRHLRYFVAVAEEGSLTVAAERRLHTAQPSLSRQIRSLEYEVGVELMTRSARGIELTAAGRAFLEPARLALTQAEAAVEAARRAARPAKSSFALGFPTGQEMNWLPRAMNILKDELPNINVTASSDHSPRLADALMRGKLDAAFLRPELKMPDLEYKVVTKEALVVVMPSDRRLAAQPPSLPVRRHRLRHTDPNVGRRDILLVFNTLDSDGVDATETVSTQRSCCVSHKATLSPSLCLDQADPLRPSMT
jgi:LysR family hca operon transcriptional activator